jgi:hypothetical protein
VIVIEARAAHVIHQNTCPSCARAKQPRYPFCLSCYKRLPPELQAPLFRPVSAGKVRAFNAALAWLKDHHGAKLAR